MAATVLDTKVIKWFPAPQMRVKLSTLVAGAWETISHGGPSGVEAQDVEMTVETPTAAGDTIQLVRDRSSDSTTNNTIAVKFICTGSITGAVVTLKISFLQHGSGSLD